MYILDAHCDTITEIIKNHEGLLNNRLQVDLKRMGHYDSYTQIFAAWLENEQDAMAKFLQMAETFHAEVKQNAELIAFCQSYEDLKAAQRAKKNAAFLAVEGAYMVDKIEDIDLLYQKGVRFVTLTWNWKNRIAGGVESDLGVTDLGREVIGRMEALGMIVDVSHLNERSFWDVAASAKKPFIATHSNAFSICPHKRNLTDDQFIKICQVGGCVGINFYTLFLNQNNKADMHEILVHIKHFIKLGGEDHIGLGSDFDGVDTLPKGISGVEDMAALVDMLIENGITESQIDKITHLNFERVIKESL